MGFTTDEYKIGYITTTTPYICLKTFTVQRNAMVYVEQLKYRISGVFSVYYSQSDKDTLSKPEIDNFVISYECTTLPNDICSALYERCKQDNFSGKQTTDC